ncbi:MAG: hypothetical protein JK586_05605 [Nocardiopsis sp. BM-2018]|uniref:Transmembrane protein n=1 Tax=Nocardiopsis metallicus TaxID=179819 RepID=A0A840W8C9_9ACTN|nr:hypothetical protein [Nocardiopsis metallicus]MBB5493310.1 hypothetical protein [Nocardiopsis metallicus]QRN80976.1 MAG: hypothetical protein JK586_05605 [Nocardiopsis sp. BM-2018]
MPGHILALKLIPLVFLTAAFVCMLLAFLWNRRGQRSEWSDRALARQAPTSAERTRVSPYLRHGATAPDPELAHLTVRVAEDLRRRLENPWYHTGIGLFVFGSALSLIINAQDWGVPGLMWFGFAVVVLVFHTAFYRRVTLGRADRALAANQGLAERYEVPEETPPPPRER